MEIIILFVVGLGVGLLSSFFGVGGGIIIVPTLFTLFPDMSSPEVISVSLLTIFLNTIINNYQFVKRGMSPTKKTIKIFVFFCALGALVGTLLVSTLDSMAIKKFFGVILLFVVTKLIFYKDKKQAKAKQLAYVENPKILGVSAFIGSLLSALTGLGGGVVYVPLFTDLAKVPLKRVAAFSNMAMMISVCFALIPHIYQGHTKYEYGVLLFLGAFVTSNFGIRLNDIVKSSTKKYLFACILLISSFKILFF